MNAHGTLQNSVIRKAPAPKSLQRTYDLKLSIKGPEENGYEGNREDYMISVALFRTYVIYMFTLTVHRYK